MTPIQLAILRRALLPVLADDECYPPGELPRRMSEDEVRHHDGSALKMTMLKAYGGEPYVHISLPVDSYSWDPGSDVHELADSHPARVIGQWHRLQSFWDKHQRVFNLSWAFGVHMVTFSANDGRQYGYSGTWDANTDLSPTQRATVEAFFAKGPPVELAEDEFVDHHGIATEMRVIDGTLEVRVRGSGIWDCRDAWSRGEVESQAAEYPSSGWPRALAYFDRHVAKPEPARVTDVRFIGETVHFRHKDHNWIYFGKWFGAFTERQGIIPSDIALIERCWAEGQRPACVPADVKDGDWACIEGATVWRNGERDWISILADASRVGSCSILRDRSLAENGLSYDGAYRLTESIYTGARKWAGWDVTPSGEVKAPTRDELRAEIAQCAKELEAATRRAGESGASSICVSWPGETVVDLTELREAWSRAPREVKRHIMVHANAAYLAIEVLVGA